MPDGALLFAERGDEAHDPIRHKARRVGVCVSPIEQDIELHGATSLDECRLEILRERHRGDLVVLAVDEKGGDVG